MVVAVVVLVLGVASALLELLPLPHGDDHGTEVGNGKRGAYHEDDDDDVAAVGGSIGGCCWGSSSS